jgi:DeoR family fructose operon transcriptional repressor
MVGDMANETAETASSATDSDGKKLFPEERRARIVEMLETSPKVLATDLAREFDVSMFTVRSDLVALEKAGALRRCYGGAIPVSKVSVVADYGKRSMRMHDAKVAIGQAAAKMVSDGDTIFVDTGTTTIEMMRFLNMVHGVTVVTNDIAVADYAETNLPEIEIILLGGIIRRGYRYTTGTMVLDQLASLHADKAFVSSNGFKPSAGFSSEDVAQSKIKRMYVDNADTSIVLVDSSKIGSMTFCMFADVGDIDVLVTDRPFADDVARLIDEKNPLLDVVVA